MSGTRLHTLLSQLTTRQPVMVVGAAVIDVIADAYALPRRGCDIELKQQSVNVGGCALNIAVTLKRLGIEADNALPLGQGCGRRLFVTGWQKRDCSACSITPKAITAGVWRWLNLMVNVPLCRSAVWKISGIASG